MRKGMGITAFIIGVVLFFVGWVYKPSEVYEIFIPLLLLVMGGVFGLVGILLLAVKPKQ